MCQLAPAHRKEQRHAVGDHWLEPGSHGDGVEQEMVRGGEDAQRHDARRAHCLQEVLERAGTRAPGWAAPSSSPAAWAGPGSPGSAGVAQLRRGIELGDVPDQRLLDAAEIHFRQDIDCAGRGRVHCAAPAGR